MKGTKKILIKEFVKDKKVGAAFSSSKHIVKKLLSNINFKEAEILVEYGPGKGVITKKLLEQMYEGSVLYVFETNEAFLKELTNIDDKRLVIINADAQKAQTILKNRYKIEKVDYIISTIPFTFIDRRKRKRIITKTFNLLNKNGKFITYQYSGLIYRLIKHKFIQTQRFISFLNMPPAIIFIGIK